MGWAGTAYQNPGRDTRQSLFFCQNPGRDVGRDNHYFFPMIYCFRTSFPVLERKFPVLEHPFLFQNVLFLFFVFFGESDFVPGRPGTEEFVPGFFLRPCSGTKGQRDVPSLGNPSIKYTRLECLVKYLQLQQLQISCFE